MKKTGPDVWLRPRRFRTRRGDIVMRDGVFRHWDGTPLQDSQQIELIPEPFRLLALEQLLRPASGTLRYEQDGQPHLYLHLLIRVDRHEFTIPEANAPMEWAEINNRLEPEVRLGPFAGEVQILVRNWKRVLEV